MNEPLFITYEGPEGSGKTSVICLISNYLRSKGIKIVNTREPGGVRIAEEIRGVILNVNNKSMDEITETLLYASARRQHLAELVIPKLNDGYSVICDRFIDSSLAYQGYARGIGIDKVLDINKWAIEDCMPDITFYLDIEPEIGLKRIAINKEREVNRLDLERIEFHKRVREGYLLLLEKYPDRIKKINANQPLEKVVEDNIKILNKMFDL